MSPWSFFFSWFLSLQVLRYRLGDPVQDRFFLGFDNNDQMPSAPHNADEFSVLELFRRHFPPRFEPFEQDDLHKPSVGVHRPLDRRALDQEKPGLRTFLLVSGHHHLSLRRGVQDIDVGQIVVGVERDQGVEIAKALRPRTLFREDFDQTRLPAFLGNCPGDLRAQLKDDGFGLGRLPVGQDPDKDLVLPEAEQPGAVNRPLPELDFITVGIMGENPKSIFGGGHLIYFYDNGWRVVPDVLTYEDELKTTAQE